jgi:hypothetical protein
MMAHPISGIDHDRQSPVPQTRATSPSRSRFQRSPDRRKVHEELLAAVAGHRNLVDTAPAHRPAIVG